MLSDFPPFFEKNLISSLKIRFFADFFVILQRENKRSAERP